MANGTLASSTYDNADQLLILANRTTGGTTLSSFNYTYNAVGNRTRILEANGDVLTLSYDQTSQLINEMRSGADAYNISYSYDGVGNRTLLLNSGVATTSTYNAGNELVISQNSAGVTTNAYDGDGNLLTSLAPGNHLTTNTWNGENRLTQVALPSGIVNCVHIQRGRPSSPESGFDRNNEPCLGPAEYSGGDKRKRNYTVSVHVRAAYLRQSYLAVAFGADSFYLFDALGSSRELSNASGQVIGSYLYNFLRKFGQHNWSDNKSVSIPRKVGILPRQRP